MQQLSWHDVMFVWELRANCPSSACTDAVCPIWESGGAVFGHNYFGNRAVMFIWRAPNRDGVIPVGTSSPVPEYPSVVQLAVGTTMKLPPSPDPKHATARSCASRCSRERRAALFSARLQRIVCECVRASTARSGGGSRAQGSGPVEPGAWKRAPERGSERRGGEGVRGRGAYM